MPRYRTLIALLSLGWLLSSCGGTAAHPVSSALGAPTTNTPPVNIPLYGFQPGFPVLRSGQKVDLLLLDADWDPASAVNRWPIVKALDQFGAWSGLRTETSDSADVSTGTLPAFGAVPTFDFSHAGYRSPYVAFVHQIVQPTPKSAPRRLPSLQETLFLRVLNTPQPVSTFRPYRLPVVIVGGYGMHGPIEEPVTVSAPVTPNNKALSQTFAGLQKAMRQGAATYGIGYMMNEFNAYANVVTTLICHADGMRPARVCTRSVIKQLVTQLR